MRQLRRRFPEEPYRQRLGAIAERLRRTRAALTGETAPRTGGYGDAAALDAELAVAPGRARRRTGSARVAWGELADLRWQVATFGFHLASLEVRQHAAVHRAALAALDARRGPRHEAVGGASPWREVLATFRAIARIQARLGVEACRRYVICFTTSPDDVATVLELARRAAEPEPFGRPVPALADLPAALPVLDVVPLLESAEALESARRACSTRSSRDTGVPRAPPGPRRRPGGDARLLRLVARRAGSSPRTGCSTAPRRRWSASPGGRASRSRCSTAAAARSGAAAGRPTARSSPRRRAPSTAASSSPSRARSSPPTTPTSRSPSATSSRSRRRRSSPRRRSTSGATAAAAVGGSATMTELTADLARGATAPCVERAGVRGVLRGGDADRADPGARASARGRRRARAGAGGRAGAAAPPDDRLRCGRSRGCSRGPRRARTCPAGTASDARSRRSSTRGGADVVDHLARPVPALAVLRLGDRQRGAVARQGRPRRRSGATPTSRRARGDRDPRPDRGASSRARSGYLLLVTGRDRLLAGHPTLARSIELRHPYIDALSALQVELLGRLRRAEADGADRTRRRRSGP